ncbi:jerky protein homolog-like [Bombus pyrosoma]|uniref:jerky protein homolog-like n=1 Tax=Bombus pyrosoma TaxID=396416 RepID=UPI001CB97015|nr:jerky protein homolog-like [Bombus pyrosoma]
MTSKRKRVLLSIAEKYDIIQMMREGETHKAIAKKYNIALTTVGKIKVRNAEITAEFQNSSAAASSSAKYLKKPQGMELEKFLYQWYLRNKDKNIRVTGPVISKKAMEFTEKLQGESTFTASARWVSKFKSRYHIREKDVDEHFRMTNQAEADITKNDFEQLLLNEGYSLENVYNADNIGVMWRAVPEETCIFHCERTKTSKRRFKEKVTTFLCVNATGSHRLPILIIAGIEKSLRNKNIDIEDLPIMYRANTRGWMDRKIFNEWFDECFLKSIIERQIKTGRREKTLLLLDNASLDHESGLVSTKDEFVNIMYFSFDATPLIQPMDHGIIACFKRMYRKELLETIMPLPYYHTEDELIINHDKLKFRDCCRIMRDAWLNVYNAILKNAWNKLLKHESEESAEDLQIIERDIDEILQLLQKLPGCEGCDRASVISWFEIDKRHDIDKQVNIADILIDFIKENMAPGEKEYTDSFEEILDDISRKKN